MLIIPERFERRRIQISGDDGERWINRLPGIFAELCKRWNLTIDGEPLHGEVGLVVPVRRDGDVFVLKVSYPDEESAHEALALQTWNGDGAVMLVDSDQRCGAILMERLDSDRTLLSIDGDEAIKISAQLLRRLAVVAPPAVPTLANYVDYLISWFARGWEQSGRVIPRAYMDAANDWLESYFPHTTGVLVNTDLHRGNVLASNREPWLVIDPKVIVGDLEYGVAPMIWTLGSQVLSSSLLMMFDIIVEHAQLDVERARQWTIIRSIDYWLWAWKTGLTTEPVKCKHIIERLTDWRV